MQIDKRAAQVNADYEERKAKLDQARQLRKEARRTTHEAIVSHEKRPDRARHHGRGRVVSEKSRTSSRQPRRSCGVRRVPLPRPQALRPRRWEDSDVR